MVLAPARNSTTLSVGVGVLKLCSVFKSLFYTYIITTSSGVWHILLPVCKIGLLREPCNEAYAPVKPLLEPEVPRVSAL